MARITIDGQTYEADDATLAQMAKDGVKYSAAPAQEGGFWQNAGDALRGGAHGFTAGLADAKFGDSNQSLMQRAGLDDYDKVKERSPVLTTAGDVGGSLVNPLGELGMAAKGASLAARVGRGMLGSGVESLVREAADQGQQGSAEKALEAGGIGAGVGALIPGLGAGVNALGKTQLVKGAGDALGDLASKVADTARNKAFGIGNKELQDLARKNGATDIAANTAAHLEQLLPSPKWGSSAASKGEALGTMRDKFAQEIGDSLDEAGTREGLNAFVGPSQGNPGSWAAIQQKLAQEASGLKQASPGELARFNAANGFASRLENEAAPTSLGGLHKRVSDWGKEAYGASKNKAISTPETTAAGEAAELGRDIGRSELDNIMQYATPQTQQRFDDSMQGYGKIADYANAAEQRGVTEQAASKVMGGAVGIAAPVVGLMTGGIPGAIAGGMTALHSGTRNYLTQLAESSRGYDIAANALRAATPKLRNTDSLVQGLGEALAKQGNRKGAVALEGDIAPAFISDPEDEAIYR